MSQTIEVTIPTLHTTQKDAWLNASRFYAIRCGRRWGKTVLGEAVACSGAIRSEYVGWFSPEYKLQSEAYADIVQYLGDAVKTANKVDGVVRTISGGRIDFWTLDNPNAGRSRHYHKVIIDEAAFAKPVMTDIWNKSIRPTLVDYRGTALVLSNTNGVDVSNWFYKICTDPQLGFTQYHAPTSSNPYIPQEELTDIEASAHPLVWQQEYLAEFVDWSGVAFFGLDKLLVEGQPVPYPAQCDFVFAIVDSAVKSGKTHDGTGVSYWARNIYTGHRLICLDWEINSIDGALLEKWIPSVFQRCEELAKMCGARQGSAGVMIEDAQSGSILIQQCQFRNWPATALPSNLTAMGKDGRAINASEAVYSNKVKFSEYAYNKTTEYHGLTRNHMVSEVVGFRIGDKDSANRADDLLDTFTYAVAITFGNVEGVA